MPNPNKKGEHRCPGCADCMTSVIGKIFQPIQEKSIQIGQVTQCPKCLTMKPKRTDSDICLRCREENYSHLSHTHCWNHALPPCNKPIEKHTQCCLCDITLEKTSYINSLTPKERIAQQKIQDTVVMTTANAREKCAHNDQDENGNCYKCGMDQFFTREKYDEKCPRCGGQEWSIPDLICDKCHWQNGTPVSIPSISDNDEAHFLDLVHKFSGKNTEYIALMVLDLLSQAKQKEREEIRAVIEKIDAGGGGSGRRIKMQLLDYLDGK